MAGLGGYLWLPWLVSAVLLMWSGRLLLASWRGLVPKDAERPRGAVLLSRAVLPVQVSLLLLAFLVMPWGWALAAIAFALVVPGAAVNWRTLKGFARRRAVVDGAAVGATLATWALWVVAG